MFRLRDIFSAWMIPVITATAVSAADWTQFRGPGGLGISTDKGVPARWSATKNIAWKAVLPGPGASSPITLGDRIFVTCYSGYGLEPAQGRQQDLVRHLICLSHTEGNVLWHQKFQPVLPEHQYQGEGSYHG